MEDGKSVVPLPRIDDVEVPSYRLLRQAYNRALHKVLPMVDVEVVWRSKDDALKTKSLSSLGQLPVIYRLVGRAMAASLLQGKGVRLPGLGFLLSSSICFVGSIISFLGSLSWALTCRASPCTRWKTQGTRS